MYGILNYINKLDKYRAVEPTAPAPKEFLDNDGRCVLPFAAAFLDAASLQDFSGTNSGQSQSMATIQERPYEYDTDVHKNFPARRRALAILRRFDRSVYVDKLNNSTIKYDLMRAK